MIFICQQSEFDTEQRHTQTPIVPHEESASPGHTSTIIVGKCEGPDPPPENLKAAFHLPAHLHQALSSLQCLALKMQSKLPQLSCWGSNINAT